MSAWDRTKKDGKAAFDKGWALLDKLGAPVNKFTNRIGSEAFWPTTLDHECDKCARILKSFCSSFPPYPRVLDMHLTISTEDGFYKEQPNRPGSSPGPRSKPKVLVKIPQKVIRNCVGLAIFTVMRTGLWVSGAGGSGVLLARKEDGSWSPPSGILIHTLGVGFMAGIDIYDCVVVINNREALEAFSKVRVSLGGEISAVAGPLGVGGILDSEVTRDRRPLFSYMKSRGLYGGIQLDGTIIIERNDENARFYGERVPVREILKGHVRRVPPGTRMLMEIVKQADGRTDLDQSVLDTAHGPAPGDLEIEKMNEPTFEQQQYYAPPQAFYAPTYQQQHHAPPQGFYAPTHQQPPVTTYQQPPVPHSSHPYHPGPSQRPPDSGFQPPPEYYPSAQGPSFPPPPNR
jgi:lipid-binding SYLF domain-containing protein